MKVRKKPVVVDAWRWGDYDKANLADEFFTKATYGWCVKTLEGPLRIRDDDYLIKGVTGEYYPCKPEIFEATYEIIEDEN